MISIAVRTAMATPDIARRGHGPQLEPHQPIEVGSCLLPVADGPILVTGAASGLGGRLLARLLGLRPGRTVRGSLEVRRRGRTETWTRRFGKRTWSTKIEPDPYDVDRLVEHLPLGAALSFEVKIERDWARTMTLRSLRIWGVEVCVDRHLAVAARIDPDGWTDVLVRAFGAECSYRAIPEDDR